MAFCIHEFLNILYTNNYDSFLKIALYFLKVPLKDDPNFASVNVRELIMLTKVLPQLQEYLDTECDGFFRLPMPEVVHCYYDGNGLFVFN